MTSNLENVTGWRRSASLIVLIATVFATACAPDTEEQIQQTPPFTVTSATQALWTERQGIGPDWYTFYYDRTTSMVANNYVYAIEEEGRTTFLEILSYSNKRGEKGYFTFKIANGTDEPKIIEAKTNVIETPICLSFSQKNFVDCGTYNGEVDLFIATPKRVVLDSLFELKNPSIYTVPKEGRTTYAIVAKSMEDVDRHGDKWKTSTTKKLPNVYKDRSQSRLYGATRNGLVQVTVDPEYYTSAWIFHDIDKSHAKVDLLCSHNLQDYPLKDSKIQSFDLSNLEADSVYGIKFCEKRFKKVKMPRGLFHAERTPDGDVVTYDVYLYVNSDGSKDLVLSPNTTSWAYGELYKIDTLNGVRDLQFYNDIVQFAHSPY